MSDFFKIYFHALMRPFHTHELLRQQRESIALDPQEEEFGLVEALSVSWVFASAKALYSLIAIILGLYWVGQSPELSESFFVSMWSHQVQKITVYMVLLEFILFPISQLFYTKFWGLLIKFFCLLFDMEKDRERLSSEVATYSLASNLFLLIPVFGQLIRHLAGLVLIYAGLRKNIGFNVLQSLMVLLAPFILVLFFIFLTLLYIVLIISLL